MKLKDKLFLYFFDPTKNEEIYSRHYRLLSKEAVVAYSPLYQLRRQTLLLSGKINGLKKNVLHIPYLSAIIISNISISSLAEVYYGRDKISVEEYECFYQQYLNKDPVQQLGLRTLRNALEHNNFQLFTRVHRNNKNGTKRFFNCLIEYLSNQNEWDEIWRPDKESIEFIKIGFALGKNPDWKIISSPAIQDYVMSKNYIRVLYQIDPFQLIDRIEAAIKSIGRDIRRDNQLLNQFDTVVSIDNWTKVYRT